MIKAVVFDLDGVLIDSEHLWDEVRRDVVARLGGTWRDEATTAMQGMSSVEWSAYMRDQLGLGLPAEEINDVVVADLLARYDRELPLLPGAIEAVERLGAHWPLGLASSANRVIIDKVLDVSGMAARFGVTVSSEETARGKPAPDVYLEAVRRLDVPSHHCVAVEDATNGIRSAVAAGMPTVVIPNRLYPPAASAVDRAQLVLASLDELTVDALEHLDAAFHERADRRLDEQEVDSFPASDPHSDWAGPPG